MRTEAERNRLIINNMHLVPMLASAYRGAKGIDFEDLESAGREGLVKAAWHWQEAEDFAKYANASIRNSIVDFIRGWVPYEEPDSNDGQTVVGGLEPAVDEFYVWQSWGDRDFINAISEHWTETVTTPEQITLAFDGIKHAGPAIHSAMIGLSRRERGIFHARFFKEPRQTIESIARHHKISYARTIFLLDRIVKTIRSRLPKELLCDVAPRPKRHRFHTRDSVGLHDYTETTTLTFNTPPYRRVVIRQKAEI